MTQTMTSPAEPLNPYQDAADRQGLREVQDALDAAGIGHSLFQSGGWTMIVEVPAARGVVIWITNDVTSYLVGPQLRNDDDDLDDDEFIVECATLDDMVAAVRGLVEASAR